ncbi:ribonucleoside-diphosphate reductase large subunit [Pseudomonas phage vB_PpuM-Amme-1]
MYVIRRDGSRSLFQSEKIRAAIERAFFAVHGRDADIPTQTGRVTQAVESGLSSQESVHIEVIQEGVLAALIAEGHPRVEHAYRVYRDARTAQRELPQAYTDENGTAISIPALTDILARVSFRLPYDVTVHLDLVAVARSAFLQMFNGIKAADVHNALILATRAFIERAPEYSNLAAQLLLAQTAREVWDLDATTYPTADTYAKCYKQDTVRLLIVGVKDGIYDPKLTTGGRLGFDLDLLRSAIKPERDLQFDYLGLQTLYDRYFIRRAGEGVRIEMPQTFFMRVAMGLAILESDPTSAALEFYDVLSTFDYMASTPTLFNAGTTHSQMSSCYLTTVPDDLLGIYGAIQDNAMLSKYAGGLGNDWTPVRALGSLIKGTNGRSQGVVPFLKVVNDTAVAVNQGGKRKGAVCAYLETWHMDIEEFTELRKNTGDDRRRTHDMNTANWVPDLFMDRQMKDMDWTLFTPSECPDLHEMYGEAFKNRYEFYEAEAAAGRIQTFKTVRAKDLYRKILSMIFETGHPWITFKDPCNIRSPQQHVGVVHSSNLCTEITLNTKSSAPELKDGETAVCNLGSINLPRHLKYVGEGGQSLDIDHEKLKRTVTLAVRMLDNVIDINFYPTKEAKNSNMRHRPIGLGVMGFQDVLYANNVGYDSELATFWAGYFQRSIALYAINASCDLAQLRGAYESFQGSDWSLGVLPVHTFQTQIDIRRRQGFKVEAAQKAQDHAYFIGKTKINGKTLNELESQLANKVTHGMRNSNVMAIAPTATISNIVGVTQSIEPTYEQVFVKDNLSGKFTVINRFLVEQLRNCGLWDSDMLDQLKMKNGSIQGIPEIPEGIKDVYRTAFEYEPEVLINCAIQRQIPIDQAQSLNLYMANPSGKKLANTYDYGFEIGLKTTYYLRAKAASSIEKSTSRTGGELNSVKNAAKVEAPVAAPMPEAEGAACFLRPGDPGFAECESCQ